MTSIKARLLLSLTLLLVAIVSVAGIGYSAAFVSNGDLDSVFESRVKPVRILKVVSDVYAVDIVDAAHKVRNGNLDWTEGSQRVASAGKIIEKNWADYVSGDMGADERTLANAAASLKQQADVAVAEFSDILNRRDGAALDAFVIQKLYPAIDPLTAEIGKLVELQINTAEEVRVASNARFSRAGRAMLGAIAISAAAFAFAFWTTVVGVVRPLSDIANTMLRLARGEDIGSVPGSGRADEIGSMAGAVQVFRDNAAATVRLREDHKQSEDRAALQRKAEMNRLAVAFQSAVVGIVDSVSAASGQLETAAKSLSHTAEATHERSGVVAAASEQTSSNVQGVAAASEQLAATVSEISRQVGTSSIIADEAVQQAGATNACVSQLSRSADRIGDVISLINTIAGQTNLLALNATIEAARAGDAGKGFAVVAQEVKALAGQTAKATSEISVQIASMQAATREAVDAITAITATINRMSEISGSISAAVEEQGNTTREISRNVLEAAKGTAEVASSITDVSRGASETGSASTAVLTSARSLSSESRTLRLEVEKFLDTVRAA